MKTFLLCALLAGSLGAWASVGTEKATNTGAKDTDLSGTSYTISGTYIAGSGSASADGMNNKGVKFRTGQNSSTLEFTVKEGYTITAFSFYGVSNYDIIDASKPCISVTKVEVDGTEVTSTGTKNFPAKGSTTAGSVILSDISATKKIVMTFDNSNSKGSQVNGYYEITWSKPTVAVPVGQADTPALDPLQYGTINLTDAYSFTNSTKTLVVSANRIRSNNTTQAWMNSENAGGAKKEWSATGVFKGSSFYNTGDENNAVVLRSGRTYSLTVTNCNTISALVLSGGSSKTHITIQMDIYEMDVDGVSKLSETPVTTKSTTSTTEATLTATDLNSSKIYRATFTSTHDSSNSYVYEVAFTAPNTEADEPTFNPNGGAVNGGTTIAIGSEAVHTYYQWSDTEVTLTKDSEGWIEGNSVIVPNVTATKYLYAYATNGTGLESDVVSKAFDITRVKLDNGLTYVTTAVTKKIGYAAFTNALTNPNSLDVTYSIEDGPTATGTTVNSSTGEVTLGETAGTAIIKASFAGNDDYVAGEVSYTLTLEAATVQTDVTGNKIWDIENAVSCDGDRNTNNVYMLYDNIEGLNFTEAFDATSLLVKASTSNFAYRKSYTCAQGASLKFRTTVPGIVSVKFSSPGNDARTLTVNGNEVFTSTGKVTASWYVEAGDVEMTGTKSIRIFKIEFTTVDASNVNLNASGYATFSTNYPVEVSGAKAYTAALDFANEKITCTQIANGKVPAGAGVLLFGEPNAEVTLTPTTGATALTENNLKATTLANGILATKGENNYYVLSGNTFKQFTGDAFSANKAYFEVDGENNVLARGFNIEFVDETTGINEVGSSEQEAERYYNLSGQRVALPTNGLYIVNGKKVIIK